MRNNYQTSASGIKRITAHEGEILRVYADPVGLPTFGVGHLVKANERAEFPIGKRISKATSQEYLRRDLRRFEKYVNESVAVPITQNQFDALVSFAFNVGESAFRRSSVLRNLNNRKFQAAADSLLKWNKAGGRVLDGLTNRRKAERALFLTPDTASANPAASATRVVNSGDKGKSSNIPAKTASDDLPTSQTAENITNVVQGGGTVPPDFKPQDLTVAAPPPSGMMAKARRWVLGLGIGVPSLAGILDALKTYAADGTINVREMFAMGASVARFVFPYVIYLLIAFVFFWGIKELLKQISLLLKIWVAARADTNNVEVIPEILIKPLEETEQEKGIFGSWIK